MKKILLFLSFLLMSIGVFGTTVSVSISDYAIANSWVNDTKYTSVTINSDITASASGGGNTGKYYTSDNSWRFYANEPATLSLTTTSGTFSSVILTYTVKDSGKITYNGNSLTSGTAVSVSGSNISFSIGQTSGSKGKIFITSISVIYSGGQSYTITAQSSNNSYGTVSLDGSVITASPNTCYTYASPSYTVSSGTATVSQGTGDNINKFTVTPTSNCTITISFEAMPKYTVTYNANDGTVSPTSFTQQTCEESTTLPTPTRDGYTFTGWYTLPSGGTKISNAGISFIPTSDTTLYAQWIENEPEPEECTIFHETFGDNPNSARAWDNSYSVKSGVSAVYSGVSYTTSNVKQGKNTTGKVLSGLNQSSQGTDAYIIIGPLNVENYSNLVLTYWWKAASINGTYSTHLYYTTSSNGIYTEIVGTGTGATSFVECEYNLPSTT